MQQKPVVGKKIHCHTCSKEMQLDLELYFSGERFVLLCHFSSSHIGSKGFKRMTLEVLLSKENKVLRQNYSIFI